MCEGSTKFFRGSIGHFGMFVPHCSIVARPLLNLLRKNIEFKFESPEREAFERLKIILYNMPVLKLYRKGTESELHTDA